LRYVRDNRNAFSKVVLLTDSAESRAYETLRFWSLDGSFDEIVCNGGHGDKYTNYFKAFDSDPAACVVWENENRQIHAAIAAGVKNEDIRKVA
jgi:FMN phosphatase YigB (HAD superfamily)